MYHKRFKPSFRNHRGPERTRSQNHRGRNPGKTQSIHASKYVNQVSASVVDELPTVTHKFTDFQINEGLKQTILARGFTTPTPIQDQAIPHLLQGKDVVGIANTGTGKTAAFLIPILNKIIYNRSEKALIIVPTRELAVQVREELTALSRSFGVSSVLCIGGANINRQIDEVRQNPSVVVGTPGRLKDIINRGILRLDQFRTIVLDEVDRMVDIGFIKDIRFIISKLPYSRQSLFFSATVSADVAGIVQSFLKNPVTISVKVKETAGGIDQDIIRVKTKDEKLVKLNSMLRQQEFKKVLIFGRTKWNVEKLAKTLIGNGFSAASIHGNKSQNQRLKALSQFKQNHLQVLVATDIAARGLDINDVSHVINFDEPSTYTDYVHRIGRTGRANKQGRALTFVL